jgi:hypothetical protein
LYVSWIDNQTYLVRFDHGANLELAPKMTAAFAADAEELYHVPDMRELAHFISPPLLTNHPAGRRHEPGIPARARVPGLALSPVPRGDSANVRNINLFL